MESLEFCAGIVVYNPNIVRLKENLNAILKQVSKVVLIDNASSNLSIDEFKLNPKIEIILNDDNYGIAHALNQICNYANDNGFLWAITLDQDSVVPDNLLEEYKLYASNPIIGMLSPVVVDRNCGILETSIDSKDTEIINRCITSASAIRIEAWDKVGGFYEPYFIDAVDFDMCYCLKEKGFTILRCNKAKIFHELGHSKKIKFLFKDNIIYNHSELRYYYISRNALLLGERHNCIVFWILTIIKRVILILLFEENKYSKTVMIIKGINHYLLRKFGKYNGK